MSETGLTLYRAEEYGRRRGESQARALIRAVREAESGSLVELHTDGCKSGKQMDCECGPVLLHVVGRGG